MNRLFNYDTDEIERKNSLFEVIAVTVLFILFIPSFRLFFSVANPNNIRYGPEAKISFSWIYIFVCVLLIVIGFFIFLLIKHKAVFPGIIKEFIWSLRITWVAVLGGFLIFYLTLIPCSLIGKLLVLLTDSIFRQTPDWLRATLFMFLPFFFAGLWTGYKMKNDGYTWGIITASFIIFFLVLADKDAKIISTVFYVYGAKIYILLSIFTCFGSKLMTLKKETELKKQKDAAEKALSGSDERTSDNTAKKRRRRK